MGGSDGGELKSSNLSRPLYWENKHKLALTLIKGGELWTSKLSGVQSEPGSDTRVCFFLCFIRVQFGPRVDARAEASGG